MNKHINSTPKFDEQDLADFEEAFELFDKDGNGTICASELRNLLRCFGKKATEDEVFAILKRYNKTGENEQIEFQQFLDIMGEIMTEPEFDDEIIQVYKVFDRDDKGINERELMDVMNKLLELKYIHNQRTQGGNSSNQAAGGQHDDEDASEDHLSMDADDRMGHGETPSGEKKPYHQITLEEAKEMIQEADMDGDGRLAFEELARILMDKSEARVARTRTDNNFS